MATVRISNKSMSRPFNRFFNKFLWVFPKCEPPWYSYTYSTQHSTAFHLSLNTKVLHSCLITLIFFKGLEILNSRLQSLTWRPEINCIWAILLVNASSNVFLLLFNCKLKTWQHNHLVQLPKMLHVFAKLWEIK